MTFPGYLKSKLCTAVHKKAKQLLSFSLTISSELKAFLSLPKPVCQMFNTIKSMITLAIPNVCYFREKASIFHLPSQLLKIQVICKRENHIQLPSLFWTTGIQ